MDEFLGISRTITEPSSLRMALVLIQMEGKGGCLNICFNLNWGREAGWNIRYNLNYSATNLPPLAERGSIAEENNGIIAPRPRPKPHLTTVIIRCC